MGPCARSAPRSHDAPPPAVCTDRYIVTRPFCARVHGVHAIMPLPAVPSMAGGAWSAPRAPCPKPLPKLFSWSVRKSIDKSGGMGDMMSLPRALGPI